MATVVKRTEGEEEYDERKVYTSIVMACTAADHDQDWCEDVAAAIASNISDKVANREEVLSVEIRMWVRNALKEYDETLAQDYYTG